MTHQVLEEYNSLPTTNHKQHATKLSYSCRPLTNGDFWLFEQGENYSIQFEFAQH